MGLGVYLLLFLATNLFFCKLEKVESGCNVCNCSIPTVVDCSSRNLQNIPNNLDKNTTELYLSSNRITKIKKGLLKKFKNLIVLDLSNNSLKIENFLNSTFDGLSRVKVLDISNNDQLPLTNVTTPLMLFESLRSLEVLKMYGTTGTYKVKQGYPGKQLGKLQSLKELWIDGRDNMKFDEEFRNITTLRILRLAGDHIEPPWRSKEFCMMNIEREMLDNLVSLTHLYIRKCNVEKVDKDAFKRLQNLQYLDLSLNSHLTLERISKALGSLQNNTNTLVLNNIESVKPNKYTVIFTTAMAQSVSHIPLKELHLDNNRIELVEPSVFETLPSTLQIVSLKQNEFFPGYYVFSARYLKNLTHLDLSYQSFKSNWAVLHQSSTRDSSKADVSSDENEKVDLIKVSQISSANVTGNGIMYPLGYSEIDGRFESYDNNSYEKISIDSDNITLLQNIKTQETKCNFSDRYIIEYSELSFTCPQISRDNYIPPGTIITYLPPKLEHLDISVSKLAGPIFQLILNKENSLKKLNASQSLLYCWQGPVVGLDKLEVLDLSENYCYNISIDFFKSACSLKELYLQGNILGSVIFHDCSYGILEPLTVLEVINIAYNRIEKIPSNFFLSQRNLVQLLAYDNVIEKFEVRIDHMTKLQLLDLSLNYINSLSETTRRALEHISTKNENPAKENNLIVNLKHNPIHCSCYNIDFLKWTLEHSDRNDKLVIEISKCFFQKNMSEVNIVSPGHFEYMINELEKDCKSYFGVILGITICIALVANVILGIIVHKYRWQIQYWYYVVLSNYNFRIRFRKNSYEEISDMYKYDVYVASLIEDEAERMGRSLEDEDFVMDKLRPVLRVNNLVAFVQVYHIQGKANLIREIGRAIHSSRVVLFVFSKDWHSDDDMRIAVHMWQCDSMNRKYKDSILGIRLDEMTGEDADMIQDLYCNRIIDYPNDSNFQNRETFWRECISQINRLQRGNNIILETKL